MEKQQPIKSENHETIVGAYHPIKDWVMDPKGYFLIRIDRNHKKIEVGFCKENNVIEVYISGRTPQEIYFTACERNLVSRFDHAAYLGKELEKAYLALKYDLDYVQDEEIDIDKKIN